MEKITETKQDPTIYCLQETQLNRLYHHPTEHMTDKSRLKINKETLDLNWMLG